MKKILLFICLIIYIAFISNVKVKSEVIIPKEAIRIRIIADSDNEYDQKIKLELSVELEKKIQELLKDTKDVEEARKIIKNNINNINEYIGNYLKQKNYNKKYTVIYGDNYFPDKEYKGVLYKEGYYESLLITIGKGQGKNWWCVLFPPLCLVDSESETEYKSFVKELIDKYF